MTAGHTADSGQRTAGEPLLPLSAVRSPLSAIRMRPPNAALVSRFLLSPQRLHARPHTRRRGRRGAALWLVRTRGRADRDRATPLHGAASFASPATARHPPP